MLISWLNRTKNRYHLGSWIYPLLFSYLVALLVATERCYLLISPLSVCGTCYGLPRRLLYNDGDTQRIITAFWSFSYYRRSANTSKICIMRSNDRRFLFYTFYTSVSSSLCDNIFSSDIFIPVYFFRDIYYTFEFLIVFFIFSSHLQRRQLQMRNWLQVCRLQVPELS